MSKKEKTVSTEGETTSELYYEIENVTLSGTFTNCQIYINAGSPPQPPPPPTGNG
jgi:hypothetical protein